MFYHVLDYMFISFYTRTDLATSIKPCNLGNLKMLLSMMVTNVATHSYLPSKTIALPLQ